ncbi:MAG: hypothetical protein NT157_00380 [Candidatus Micrarchaeota archaeon]|nr:hypothetical protein [Candidatus Micrarchaeota archaeon]
MDTKAVILVLFVVALVLAVYVATNRGTPEKEENAVAFVLEDLQNKYPDADIRDVLDSKLADGVWQIKARVVYDAYSPCPRRKHISYRYPAFNFVTPPPEDITNNCIVCSGMPTCRIAFREEALIASHTMSGSEKVTVFLTSHPDARGDATFYPFLDREWGFENVWDVVWIDGTTGEKIEVLVGDEGKIARIYE